MRQLGWRAFQIAIVAGVAKALQVFAGKAIEGGDVVGVVFDARFEKANDALAGEGTIVELLIRAKGCGIGRGRRRSMCRRSRRCGRRRK